VSRVIFYANHVFIYVAHFIHLVHTGSSMKSKRLNFYNVTTSSKYINWLTLNILSPTQSAVRLQCSDY